MIDIDDLVNKALASTEIYGRKVTFAPVVSVPGAPAYEITAIFDRHALVVLDEIRGSELSGPGHSTTAPALSVRVAEFAATPDQGDEVTIDGETFLLWDARPDGSGMVDLLLREKV